MKLTMRLLTGLLLGLILLGWPLAGGTEQPHRQRVGPNLLSNPQVNGSAGWNLVDGASYDSAVSRTPGSGSFKLSLQENPGAIPWVETMIPVIPGRIYTFAGYLNTNAWPAVIKAGVSTYDAQRQFIRDASWDDQAPSRADAWEEFVVLYEARPGDAFAQVGTLIWKDINPSPDRVMWVDDVYFGEGIGFEQPLAAKRAFDGQQVRIDALGNFEVLKDASWTPFFPLAIWTDGSKPLSRYSQQGLNAVFTFFDPSEIQAAKDATSAFNPDGMMALPQISPYIQPDGWAYNNLAGLRANIDLLVNAPQSSNILAYFWDNEAYDQYDVPVRVTETIKQQDVDSRGGRLHPIVLLIGYGGRSRMYNALVDMTGVYTSTYGHMPRLEGKGLLEQGSLEQQMLPAGLANFTQNETAEVVRIGLYSAIIYGAKMMTWWMDPMPQGWDANGNVTSYHQIEDMTVWPELPKLRREVDALMPLIRQPHWTTWTVTTPAPLTLGTRALNGLGYVLLVNPTSDTVSTTLTLAGLPYVASSVTDYFDGRPVATVSGTQFSVTLPPCTPVDPSRCTAVYRLESAEGVLRGDLNGDGKRDLADVRWMIEMLVGTRPKDLTTADLDGDGLLALADCQALIRLLVGGP